MRPRGAIRQALLGAAQTLAAQQGGATWREMAAHARVGWDAARKTVGNMVAAGELQPCGQVRAPHACRPMVLYTPQTGGSKWTAEGFALDLVVRRWGTQGRR